MGEDDTWPVHASDAAGDKTLAEEGARQAPTRFADDEATEPPRPERQDPTEPTAATALPDPGATEPAPGRVPSPAPLREATREDTLQRPSEHPTRPTAALGEGQPAARGGDPAGDDAGTLFAGRFEVQAVLGEGGMGKVFRVRDRQIEGREVALKVLRPRYSRNARFRELFFQEIHAAQNFVSEHVNQVRDTGQMEDGKLFLTMDLVEGESLASLLARDGALATRHALEITRQILLGLQSGHEKGFIHRDVKPANVMLAARVPRTEDNPFGVGVRLLDFGIAALTASIGEGSVAGTPRYMSPEQVQGERLDPRSDLFTVGIVLYRMLCGKMPFEGSTVEEVKTAVLETNLAPLIGELQGVPVTVRKILRKALQKDRAKRFQSASEFAEAVERLQVSAERGGAPRWVAAAAVLFAISSMAFGFLYYDKLQEQRLAPLKLQEMSSTIAGLRKELSAKEEERKELLTHAAADALALERLDRWKQESGWEERKSFYDEWYYQIKNPVESERLPVQFEDLQRQFRELSDQVAALSKQNEILEQQSSAISRSARGFDTILTFLEEDRIAYAENEFATLNQDRLLTSGSGTGGDLLETLVRTQGDIDDLEQRFARGERVEIDRLDPPRQGILAAREQLGLLERVATPWLSFSSVHEGGEQLAPKDAVEKRLSGTRERIDRLDERLALLETQVQEHASESEGEISKTWQGYLAASFPDDPRQNDPTAALSFAAENGQDPAPLAAGYLAYLHENVLESELFPLAELRRERALEVWGRRLAGGGSALADGEVGLELRLVWTALQWYAKLAQPTELVSELKELRPLFEVPSQAEPHHDWRAQFALQAQGLLERPEWLVDGWDAIYHQRWSKDGQVWWWTHRGSAALDRGRDAWRIRRVRYLPGNDRDPQTEPQDMVVQLDAGCLYVDEEKRLDAFALDANVRVALWQPELEAPAQARWARNLDLAQFSARVRSEPVPCIVISDSTRETWFSPQLGLVREVMQGVHERELVYRAPSRR